MTAPLTPISPGGNVDAGEVAKFGALAHHWWDSASTMFGPLHKINPLRLRWIEQMSEGVEAKHIVDVGCGGGILSESLAARGARVVGIDLGEKALGVAKLHQLESGSSVDYRLVAAERLAAGRGIAWRVRHRHLHGASRACAGPGLDHRRLRGAREARRARRHLDDQPQSQGLRARDPRCRIRTADASARHARLLLTPAEIAGFGRRAGLDVAGIIGMTYNPLAKTFSLDQDTDVNYMMAFRRPADD